MARNRTATAPLPPPVESSEDTGLRSSEEEVEESEEVAHSPSAVATNDTAEQEEEEEEVPDEQVEVPEEQEEEEEEVPEEQEEEEEEEAATESEEEEVAVAVAEEESDDREAERKGKQAALSTRHWSVDDEIRILKAVAELRPNQDSLPKPEELHAALAGSLDHKGYGLEELGVKVKNLKAFYTRVVNRGGLEVGKRRDRERQIFPFCKEAWGSRDSLADGIEPEDFDEAYPYLVDKVKELGMAQHLKRDFTKMNKDQANALNEKIKKLKVEDLKLRMRRQDVMKEALKALLAQLK